jgi:hypothetical protein
MVEMFIKGTLMDYIFLIYQIKDIIQFIVEARNRTWTLQVMRQLC